MAEPVNPVIEALARAEVERRKRLVVTPAQSAASAANDAAFRASTDTYLASPAGQAMLAERRQAMIANAKRQMSNQTPLDLYGPDFRESLDNARARRIEIQKNLPDLGIESAVDKARNAAKTFLDQKTEKAGDVVVKAGIVGGAAKVGVVTKLPFLVGTVATAPAGLVLEADPLNTTESAAEAALNAAQRDHDNQVDARVAQLLAEQAIRDKLYVMPVWTQDP